MQHLWSPWRLPYVTGAASTSGCIFCNARDASDAPLVLIRGRAAYVILNLYPYNSGHIMVVPNRHIGSLAAAAEDELTEAYRPQGINVGINLGRPAGAGVVDHVHVHLVPRWTGDTNFMSVVGQVRVLPEELGESAGRLRPIFERLAKEP
jgi:ATP adenylyltransferase